MAVLSGRDRFRLALWRTSGDATSTTVKRSAQKVEIGGVVAHFGAVLREHPKTICIGYHLLAVRLLAQRASGASMGVSTTRDGNADGDLLPRVLRILS